MRSLYHLLCLYFLSAGFGIYAQAPSCASCNDQVGGNGTASSWAAVELTAKGLFDNDFSAAQVLFSGNTVTSPGVGVAGPDNSDARFKQINYVPGIGTEVLRVRFCRPGGFYGANVLLSHLYREYGKVERGAWRALDAQLQEVAFGNFEAVQNLGNGTPGHLNIEIRTNVPFYYLEFSATPYGDQRNQYQDASDYFLRALQPICLPSLVCGQSVGGDQKAQSWEGVSLSARALGSSTFEAAPVNFNVSLNWGGPLSGGLGVKSPAEAQTNTAYAEEINYYRELNDTEVLRVDFGPESIANGINAAEVLLSKFYNFENQDKVEVGHWRALDANFQEVGAGMFQATAQWSSSNPGHYNLQIFTATSFRYLEFSAGPYGQAQARKLKDDSDYLLRSIIALCKPVAVCEDLLGGSNQDWSKVLVATKALNSVHFSPASPAAFRPEWSGVASSSGIGVPGPIIEGGDRSRFHEINYIAAEDKSEAVRLDFGTSFSKAQVTVSRFYKEGGNKVERGTWIAYQKNLTGLVEVGRGYFEASENWCNTCAGLQSFEISTEAPFQVLEFNALPYGLNQRQIPADDSDYLLHEVIPCPDPLPICEEECVYAARVVSFTQGKTKNGRTIDASRSDATKALGEPQASDNNTSNNNHNFVSLGFGGELVLELNCRLTDRPGLDFEIYETSFGNPTFQQYPEVAEVFVSKDGTDWYSLGLSQPDMPRPQNSNAQADRLGARFDIAASGLPFIKYVKIIDRSQKESNRFNGLTDGFDVDGISCIQSRSGSPAQSPTVSNNQGRTRNSDTGLLLYPNVVDKAFRISFREDLEHSLPEELTVVIYNSAGQEVKRHTGKVIDEEIEIQMPAVGSGLYIVHAISDTEVRIAKILKQ